MDKNVARQLHDYLMGESYQSLLLIGSDKKEMVEAAELVASEITGGLEGNPDFMRVALADKETSIGVETAEKIKERARLLPNNAPRIVCIVEDMDRMTAQAQNKLLKLVEESETMTIVGVVQDVKKILDTIRSRCQTIRYRDIPFSMDSGDGLDFFVRGAEDRAVAKSYFQAAGNAVSGGKPDGLLDALAMIAEKSSPKQTQPFYATCRECVPSMVSFLGRKALENGGVYGEKAAQKAVFICNKALRFADTPAFTKDSFFVFIAEYLTALNRKEV